MQPAASTAPQIEVWACGSRVEGHHHEGSDLDLALRSASHDDLVRLRAAFEASALPILVERALHAFRSFDLDVRIVSHGPALPLMIELAKSYR